MDSSSTTPTGLPWVWGQPGPVAADDVARAGERGRLVVRAVDSTADADALFLWLCQLRRAPYSYDWVDNFGRRSPRKADPSLLDLEVGQDVMTIFTLTAFEPGRSISLRMKPGGPTRAFGAIEGRYEIEVLGESRTRLRVLMWMPPVGRVLGGARRYLLAWGDLLMMRQQLLTLTALAERNSTS